MSKTKIIYFLSAFVLIIGCFALTKSYSLFVQTESEEFVDSVVPPLSASLSLNSIEVEAGKEYLIKQTINNLTSAKINYTINTESTSTKYTVRTAKDSTNTYYSYGTLNGNSSYNTYLVVKNNDSETITINFILDRNYATITNTLTTNVDNENIYLVSSGGLPYSNNTESLAYKLIQNQVDTFGSSLENSNDSGIEDLFTDITTKVQLPLTGGELNVPSPTTFTSVETENVGLYKAEDDYGISYYYRGANNSNYVNFSGFLWRIVRINGDGSIRLILDGTLDKISGCNDSSFCTVTMFNNSSLGNKALYMSGNGSSIEDYYSIHENINDSIIKTKVDAFYKKYILNNEDYLADTLFCGDKTRYSYDSKWQSIMYRFYNIYVMGETVFSLKCATEENNIDLELTPLDRSYSRYTSKLDENIYTTKNVLVNNDLEYPIALLSADELIYAGAYFNTYNTSYYLANNNTSAEIWYTMTPYDMNFNSGVMVSSNYDSTSPKNPNITGNNPTSIATLMAYTINGDAEPYEFVGIRPVINLKKGILWNSGNGTSGSPYTVKLS